MYYPHNWHKIGCHGNVPREIKQGTSDLSSTAIVLPLPVKIGQVDVVIIGLAEITKIKKTSAKHKPSSPAIRAERVGQKTYHKC